MKFQSFVTCTFALAASFLLAACGGGGAAGSNQGTGINLSPATATFYAGVPATMNISGGRKPYYVTSSEPGVLPVPPVVDGFTFDVVPNNPGVIDAGLKPGELPVRTVTISVRDSSSGQGATSVIKVAQNFLTGYRLAFVTTTCPALAGATSVTPCAGGDTALQLAAVFNGNLHGDETFRLEVVRGQFSFYTPNSSTGITSNTYTTTSDHEGKITAIIRVPANAPTQIAIVRVVHVATGTSTEQVFTINGPPTRTLTAIPSSFTFTGADSTACGSGSGDFFVFDGVPPYTAVSSSSGVGVSPATSSSQPGRFTVTVANGSVCADSVPIVVTDSQGNRVTVTVSSVKGTTTPPPPPTLAVAPSDITLACNTTGSVSVVGGSGVYSVTSSHPRVNATVSGRTVSITRINGDGVILYPTTASIGITDGASIVTVNATVPANCP